jgi:hypothetical protein
MCESTHFVNKQKLGRIRPACLPPMCDPQNRALRLGIEERFHNSRNVGASEKFAEE